MILTLGWLQQGLHGQSRVPAAARSPASSRVLIAHTILVQQAWGNAAPRPQARPSPTAQHLHDRERGTFLYFTRQEYSLPFLNGGHV